MNKSNENGHDKNSGNKPAKKQINKQTNIQTN